MLGCLSQIYSHYSGCTFICKSVASMTDAEHTAKDGVALTRNSYSFHFILNSMILNSRGSLVFNLIKEMISKLYYDPWASQVVLVGKNPRANPGDIRDSSSIPGSGRSPEGGHDNPCQYSWLKNSAERGVWRATVHGVAESHEQMKQLNTAQLIMILTNVPLWKCNVY